MLLQILIIVVAIAVAILGLAWLTEATAALIIAQARADLIRAEADAIWWHSVTPVVLVVVVGIVATVGLIAWSRRKPAVERVIERQAVVYVLPGNASRREMRQWAVEQQEPLLLTTPGRVEVRVKSELE